MLSKYLLLTLFFFVSYAFSQTDRTKKDTTVAYKKSLAECKTLADSIVFNKVNAQVNLAILKMRNDSAISRFLRDSVLIDTSKNKIP